MSISLMIVDDFLQNADEFREMALGLEYPQIEKTAYPGRNSVQRVNLPGLDSEVSRLLQQNLRAKSKSGHGRFRITLADDTGIADIHMDDCHWSGIYYLSKPEHCMGGTEFYRHVETDTERALLDASDIERLGVKNKEDANKKFNDILLEGTKDRSKWEKTMEIPMRYNRLILFRPWLWHTAGPGFGDSIENGRLVYLLFFEEA